MPVASPRAVGSVGEERLRWLATLLRHNAVLSVAVAGLMGGGLALRLALAWQDLETLAVKFLPDDAFYYFLTADRIAGGQNVTFDGLNVSNGYHPLWLFFLVPFYLLPGRELPAHLALTASSVLDVIAGGLVALTVGRLTGSRLAAVFALAFYLFLPENVTSAINGVESALAAALLAGLLLTFVTVWREHRDDWLRWAVLTGLLAGLAILARLEIALVVATILALVAVFQQGAARWRAPLAAAGVAAAVVAPWFIWSAVAVGTPMPVSASASTFLWREHFSSAHPDASAADYVRHGLSYTKQVLLTQIPALYLPARGFAAALLAGAALLSAHLLLFARGELRARALGWLLVALPPVAAFGVMLFVNSAYRWFVREWYFAWGMPSVVLLIGVGVAYLEGAATSFGAPAGRWLRLPPAAWSLAALSAVAALIVVAYAQPARDEFRDGHLAFQRGNVAAARYLRANTPPDARVASFNAGVIGYFSERTVINIDGVVNPEAYDALRDHRLLAYLREAGVTYVADRDGAWRYLAAFITPDDWTESLWGEDPNAAMRPVAALDHNTQAQMRVWRLLP